MCPLVGESDSVSTSDHTYVYCTFRIRNKTPGGGRKMLRTARGTRVVWHCTLYACLISFDQTCFGGKWNLLGGWVSCFRPRFLYFCYLFSRLLQSLAEYFVANLASSEGRIRHRIISSVPCLSNFPTRDSQLLAAHC